MKLFTTMKHNTVEWPKMHDLQNGIYTIFREYTPYLYTWSLAFCASSPTEIYDTVRHGISVSKNEIVVTIVFVSEHYTWPLPRNDPERMCGYTQPT